MTPVESSVAVAFVPSGLVMVIFVPSAEIEDTDPSVEVTLIEPSSAMSVVTSPVTPLDGS